MAHRAFGIAVKAGPVQLDLFAPVSDWKCVVDTHPYSGEVSWRYFIIADGKERYAGMVAFMDEDKLYCGWISRGYWYSSKTSGGTLSHFCGEHATHEAAERAVERDFRASWADPRYIWDFGVDKEAIRKCKAVGYWGRDKEAA
jgi:hypothetical protein